MVRFTRFVFTFLALAVPAVAQEAQPAAMPQRIPMASSRACTPRNKVLVIDVRDAQSFSTGHIPGARFDPLGSLLAPRTWRN